VISAALYARVSKDEQAEKYGLASQVTELRALAERKGYTVSEGAVFMDGEHEDASGQDLDRPALTRLRAAARAGAFQMILVHDPDRLARKLAHQLLLLEEFEQASVRCEFLTTPTEKTPEGTLLLHVKGVIAEYERAKIRERTLRGKVEKARRGLWSGRAPYGYRVDPARPGALVPDEPEAAVVRMMYRWLVEEQRSIRSITTELRRLGLHPRAGGAWTKTSVSRLLTLELYTGRAYFGRARHTEQRAEGRRRVVRRPQPESEWLPIPVPALVSPELFAAAQAQRVRNRAILGGRPPARLYLLRNLVRCGRCGRPFRGKTHHKSSRLYRCAGRDPLYDQADPCRAPTIEAGRLEALVWTTTVNILKRPDVLTTQFEAHRDALGLRAAELRSEVEALTRDLADLARQEARLVDAYVVERLDVPALRARLEAIGQQKAALTARLAAARQQAGTQEATEARQDTVRRACRAALRGIDRLTPEGRQRLLRALLDVVVVRDDALDLYGVLPTSPGHPDPKETVPPINAIGPGTVNTPINANFFSMPGMIDRFLMRTPLGRIAEPEEIARVAVFLASDESSYITGTTIYADGGRLALNGVMAPPRHG
jgi:site-specific DNA recombinase